MHLKSFKMHMRFVHIPCLDNHWYNYDKSLIRPCIFMRFQLNAQVLLDSLKRKTYDDELRREELLNYFRQFQNVSQKVLLVFLIAIYSLLNFSILLFFDFEVVQLWGYLQLLLTCHSLMAVVGNLATLTALKNYANLYKLWTSLGVFTYFGVLITREVW